MDRRNCWEFFGCGREIGGTMVRERGVCPAAADTTAHGLNNGFNGGRICWAIAGTLCEGTVEGTFAGKHLVCSNCAFYDTVKTEEGLLNYRVLKPDQTA